jgi:ParB/RepB/Spo0J family partition protein
MTEIIQISAFRCRLWDKHGRMEEYITEASYKDELRSMREHGQLVPAVGRRLMSNDTHEVEIICGARRLFIARQLNSLLSVELRQVTDREAVVLLDMENRQRRDWSPYERGMSFSRWLAAGLFESQDDIARTLSISASQVSRLLKLAKLPSIVVQAFSDPCDICENWGLELHSACESPVTRSQVIARARTLASKSQRVPPRCTFDRLMFNQRMRAAKEISKQEIILGPKGEPLFRIKHQEATIALVIGKRHLSSAVMQQIKDSLSNILRDTHVATPHFKADSISDAKPTHGTHLVGLTN